MFQLSLDGIGFLGDLVQQEGIACDFTRCGAVTLAAKPAHMRALEESAHFLRDRLSYDTELLGQADLGREIGSSRYYGALLDPRGCALQPAKYVAGLAEAAARAGACLCEGAEVIRIPGIDQVADIRLKRGLEGGPRRRGRLGCRRDMSQ